MVRILGKSLMRILFFSYYECYGYGFNFRGIFEGCRFILEIKLVGVRFLLFFKMLDFKFNFYIF